MQKKTARDRTIDRDNGTCQDCNIVPEPYILNVHHIDPTMRLSDGLNAMDNLVTLCRPCHLQRHVNMRKSLALRPEALLISRREASQALAITLRTLDKKVGSGELQVVRLGGKRMFRRIDIDAIVSGDKKITLVAP